jgi:hypothetical protein
MAVITSNDWREYTYPVFSGGTVGRIRAYVASIHINNNRTIRMMIVAVAIDCIVVV